MIQLAGMPLQQSGMLHLDQTENDIFQRMQEDPIVYSYASMEELQFELKLRKNIIRSSRLMNQGESQFVRLINSRCNEKYWRLTNAGGFLLREGVKPSDAIRDIYENSALYAFECATAILIIYYHAVLNAMNEQVFNQFFQNLYLYSWHADSDLGIHTINTSYVLPGDVVYFNNPDFNPETPWWRGENAVVFEDGTYFGHGIGMENAEDMIQMLNNNRSPGSNQPAYLDSLVTRPAFHHLAKYVMSPQWVRTYKMQSILFHHNKTSISFDRYLYYLTNLFVQ